MMLHTEPALPIFTWSGGKRRMLEQYASVFFPPQFDTFVDLFAGACGITCWVGRDPHVKLIINDNNAELIAMYRALAYDGDAVEASFRMIATEYLALPFTEWNTRANVERKSFYMSVLHRYAFDYKQQTEALTAAQLLFLLKTSFSGLWRAYPKYGYRFSTPPGPMNDRDALFELAPIRNFAYMLSRADIHCGSYEYVSLPKGNTFVYADPPYRNCVVGYMSSSEWTDDDQTCLAAYLRTCGAMYYAESNRDGNDGFWERLFPAHNIYRFPVIYTGGRGTSSVDASEVLVTNYSTTEPMLF